MLAEKHDAEIENMKVILNEHAEVFTQKGLTLAQTTLVFYYLFNELGVSFANTSKTQWARFLEKVTGKHIQNIRAELNIDFDSKKRKRISRLWPIFSGNCCQKFQQK